jgi:hypothetical protein
VIRHGTKKKAEKVDRLETQSLAMQEGISDTAICMQVHTCHLIVHSTSLVVCTSHLAFTHEGESVRPVHTSRGIKDRRH